MKSVWVQRSPEAIFDPWEIEPTIIIKSLTTLSEKITEWESGI
jgi:2-haloacid dehalogenase